MKEVPSEAIIRQLIVLCPIYVNTLMMGCGLGWMPIAVYFLLAGGEVQATLFQCSLIVSSAELGKIIFAIPAGILTDKYGRRKITISAAVLNLLAFSALSLDTSAIMICAGRFIQGLAFALIDATSLTTIGEIASPKARGQLVGLISIFIIIGGLFMSVPSIVLPSYKTITYVATVFSLISLLPMYWMMETPSFLTSVLKLEKAKNNLRHIRPGYQQNEIEDEFKNLQVYIENEKTRKDQLNLIKFLKSKVIRKPLIIGILSNFFMICTGGTICTFYVTSIIPPNELIPKLYYPLISQLVLFFCCLSIPLYIDKFPRRSIFMVGAAIMTLLNLICAISKYFLAEFESMTSFKCIFITGNVFIRICFINTIRPMINSLTSELYPQTVKGFCSALGSVSQALATIIVLQVHHFFEVYSHSYFLYLTFFISSFILYLIVYFLIPEGRGVSLPDVQMKFKGKSTRYDNARVVEKDSPSLNQLLRP